MNTIYSGYYLIILQNGVITSYDGSHDSTKGVTKARDLIKIMRLSPEKSDFKMLKLQKDIPYEGKMLEKLQDLHLQGELKLESVKEQKVKINHSAANFMAEVIEFSRRPS